MYYEYENDEDDSLENENSILWCRQHAGRRHVCIRAMDTGN